MTKKKSLSNKNILKMSVFHTKIHKWRTKKNYFMHL